MRIVDEQGNVWELDGNKHLLIEPTPEWIAENQPVIEPKPEPPTIEERLTATEEALLILLMEG